MVENARRVEQIQLLVPALVAAALVSLTRDDADAALGYVHEISAATQEEGDLHRMLVAHDVARICLRAGDRALAAAAIEGLASSVPRAAACLATARAEIAESGGAPDALAAWREALAAWEPMGATIERRLAREAVERLAVGNTGETPA
jgi:hypothetical protein